jgi:hypothetical protein
MPIAALRISAADTTTSVVGFFRDNRGLLAVVDIVSFLLATMVAARHRRGKREDFDDR